SLGVGFRDDFIGVVILGANDNSVLTGLAIVGVSALFFQRAAVATAGGKHQGAAECRCCNSEGAFDSGHRDCPLLFYVKGLGCAPRRAKCWQLARIPSRTTATRITRAAPPSISA